MQPATLRTTHPVNFERSRPLYRGTQIIWYITYVAEALLFFRFLLKLIAANPNAGFTGFIYAASYPLVAPFLYVVRASRVENSVFEWTTLLAMAVYAVIAWGIIKLLAMSKPVTTGEAQSKLSAKD